MATATTSVTEDLQVGCQNCKMQMQLISYTNDVVELNVMLL